MGAFLRRAEAAGGRSLAGYDDLWRWSVEDLDGFWRLIARFFDVRGAADATVALAERSMPGTSWFPGVTLNYAEHLLRRDGPSQAVVAYSQSRATSELSHSELRDQVARARAGLARLGVGRGDRVVAYLPNIPETLVAFLATASLGAIWSSCAPEFGVRAVVDRLGQIEPTVLLVVDGYRYGDRAVDRAPDVGAIRAQLPSVQTTVAVPYLEADARRIPGSLPWSELVRDPGPLDFDDVPFDHPLYVLYSSGTTGKPKAIVHGHGGVLVEHLKMHGLHGDVRPDDRYLWFTTTGWMMWNYVVSALGVGSAVVLFDGDPSWPDPSALWRVAEEAELTTLGASPPFLMACRKAGLQPGRDHNLAALRMVGSTGAPLPAEGYRWVHDAVGGHVQLGSISGGTDVCTAFVGPSPLVPVWEGEISCRALGAAVAAVDDAGAEIVGAEGELVLTEPMPSMPVGFWGDEDGSRLRAAYFERFPGLWHHGDWVTFTDRGSCVISGRSDATLNRAGVRVGTAEFYGVVEAFDDVADSLIVHLEDAAGDTPGELVLFVQPTAGGLDEELSARIRGAIREQLSPRHVPDRIHAVAAIPRTLSGKKLEVPVKRILTGADPDAVASRDSLANPAALDPIISLADHRS